MLISPGGHSWLNLLVQFLETQISTLDLTHTYKQGKTQHEHPWHATFYVCPPGGFNPDRTRPTWSFLSPYLPKYM